MKTFNKIYSSEKLLSYEKILNFVIAENIELTRNCLIVECLNEFLKNKKQFIYVKRNKELLKESLKEIAISNIFTDHVFEVKGSKFYVDGEISGWSIPLSDFQKEKSNEYPNVTTIVCDGFLKEGGYRRYLPSEPKCLLNLMDTVFRNRDNGKTICLGSSDYMTMGSPYFVYFGLIPDLWYRFNVYENIVVENTFKGILKGEELFSNEFEEKNNVCIEKKRENSEFYYSTEFKGKTISFWYDFSNKYMYSCVGANIPKDVESFGGFDFVVNCFENNTLFFNNKKVRSLFYEMINKKDLLF